MRTEDLLYGNNLMLTQQMFAICALGIVGLVISLIALVMLKTKIWGTRKARDLKKSLDMTDDAVLLLWKLRNAAIVLRRNLNDTDDDRLNRIVKQFDDALEKVRRNTIANHGAPE